MQLGPLFVKTDCGSLNFGRSLEPLLLQLVYQFGTNLQVAPLFVGFQVVQVEFLFLVLLLIGQLDLDLLILVIIELHILVSQFISLLVLFLVVLIHNILYNYINRYNTLYL